jgi:hypothetical protein
MARQASGLLEADLPSSDRAGVEHPWLQYTLTDRRSTAAPGANPVPVVADQANDGLVHGELPQAVGDRP